MEREKRRAEIQQKCNDRMVRRDESIMDMIQRTKEIGSLKMRVQPKILIDLE